MTKCFGIISYFSWIQPDTNQRQNRLERLINQLSTFWPEIPIILISQEWNSYTLEGKCKNRIYKYDYPALGILKARQTLREKFLELGFDYLIMFDDDAIIECDNNLATQEYIKSIDDNPKGFAFVKGGNNVYCPYRDSQLNLCAISRFIYEQEPIPNIDAQKSEGFEDRIWSTLLHNKYSEYEFDFPTTIRCCHFKNPNIDKFGGEVPSTWSRRGDLKNWSYMRSYTLEIEKYITEHKDLPDNLKQNKIKTCVCALAKNENLYINEWVDHYLNLGFDHIFIYDNNDSSVEPLKINSNKVTIINIQNQHFFDMQRHYYEEFYKTYRDKYDWLAFFDVDEFLTGIDNINTFLKNPAFNNFNQIRIKWKLFGDDDLITRDTSLPVCKSFKKEITNNIKSNEGKCIVKGKKAFESFGSHLTHCVVDSLGYMWSSCLPSGKKSIDSNRKNKQFWIINDDYLNETVFVNHYMTKTLSEFLEQKLKRGDAFDNKRQLNLDYFWLINNKTKEKLEFIDNYFNSKNNLKNKKYNIRNVICACAKNENKYINNWCKYHLDLGFDHIYLYDNNDINAEPVEYCIDSKYRNNVTIIDKRGIHEASCQIKWYIDFYNKHKNEFDWCAFIDIDEFITGITDVEAWLSDPKYVNYEMIRLKWRLFGDDGIIKRDLSIPVQEFFKKPILNNGISNQGKCIVRGKLIGDVCIGSCHYAFRNKNESDKVVLKQCLPSGKPCNSTIRIIEDYSNESIYLNHYMTKTLDEFLNQKYGRGDAVFENRQIDCSYFWKINTQTEEKLRYIKDFTENKNVKKDIDLVIPYVDCNDDSWINLFRVYNNINETKEETNAVNRFRGQGDFFRFFFRGVEKNMPWVNNIFLLVSSLTQVPDWINKYNIKIITHDQFIPKQFLPVFNSTAIEMFVPFIPELSEKFVYANDDTFPINPASDEDYFECDKVKSNAKYIFSYNSMYSKHVWNSYYLTKNKKETYVSGIRIRSFGHTIRPYLKSKCIECFKKYEKDILSSISRFREEKNYNMYLYDNYLIEKELSIPTDLTYRVINSNSSSDIMSNTFYSKPSIVCLEDTSDEINIYKINYIVNLFSSMFPNSSKYEINNNLNLDKEEYINRVDLSVASQLENKIRAEEEKKVKHSVLTTSDLNFWLNVLK